MDFEFAPDTLMLRDMLRRFVQKEARPLEMKYFNAGELEPAERARLRQAVEQLGLWGLLAPEGFGGGGLDAVTACVIEEELGTTFVPVELGSVTPLLYACQGEQVGRFLEPALAGERRAIIAAREPGRIGPETWITQAFPQDAGYRLNGSKLVAARPEPEDFFIVFARIGTAQSDGTGLTAFLLDAGAPGLFFSANGEKHFDLRDCLLERGAILGGPGQALALGAGEAPRAWVQTGARYVGIASRLIEMASEHAREWVSLGAPMAARPAVRRMLAEMRVDVECSRWLVYHAAWLADTNQAGELRSAARQVRLATGEMLQRAIDKTTMVFAGPGPSPQIDLQRMVRSVLPAEALEFVLEKARAAIADEMLAGERG